MNYKQGCHCCHWLLALFGIFLCTLDLRADKDAVLIFTDAVEAGDTDLLRRLLADGVDPNLPVPGSSQSKTPLCLAVRAVQPGIVEGEDQDALDIVRLLLKHGADINFRDASGNTVLMNALDSQSAKSAVINLLLDSKPNLSIRNQDGRDALFLAFNNKEQREHIPRLLELGANAHTRDDHGNDLLMLAASNADVEWVGKLLKIGLSPTAVDADGNTAIHDLPLSKLQTASTHGDKAASSLVEPILECLSLLLSHGGSSTVPNQYGETPLHIAAWGDNADIFLKLLEQAEEVDPRLPDGRTPLHRAAIRGANENLKILLNRGADIELRDSTGMNALLFASLLDHHDSMLLLLKRGADIDATDLQGRTALDSAFHNAQAETVKLLISQGADPTRVPELDVLFLKAVSRFHRQVTSPKDDALLIQILSELASDINRPDAEGITPLMWVAASNQPAALQALIERKPDLDARAPDGRTAMMWAACVQSRAGMETLRAAGADESLRDESGRNAAEWLAWAEAPVNTTDKAVASQASSSASEILASRRQGLAAYLAEGKWDPEDRIAGVSPLHLATTLGDMEAIRTLIRLGAPVDLSAADGVTPLMEAAANNRTEAVTLFLENGADVSLRDSLDHRAIDQALQFEHVNVVRMLLTHKNALTSDETKLLTNLVHHGDAEILREALDAGAAIPAVRKPQKTYGRRTIDPSMVLVAAAGRQDPALLKVLSDFPAATGADDPAFLAAALHRAADRGRLDSLKFLIEECAVNPEAHYDESFGGVETWAISGGSDSSKSAEQPRPVYTALSRALEGGHDEVVRYLVKRGASISGRTSGGEQPVAFVVRHGKHEWLRWFLQKKAPLESLDLAGKTALHHAAELNDETAVRLLLDHGADATATTPAGLTALDLARKTGSEAVAKLLESRK